MGTDHQEIILRQLKQWRSLILQQGKSLSEGDIDRLEKLAGESAKIQEALDEIFSAHRPEKLDRRSIELLREIGDLQAGLIVELSKGSRELSDALAGLRKNRVSLQGYRQAGTPEPRFMNERT